MKYLHTIVIALTLVSLGIIASDVVFNFFWAPGASTKPSKEEQQKLLHKRVIELGNRHCKIKRGAFAFFRLNPNTTSVTLHGLLAYSKTDSCT